MTNAGGNHAFVKNHYITVSFTDVAADFWAAQHLWACMEAGIVNGYEDGSYQPGIAVTRDQMAVFIARALTGGDSSVPVGSATATFTDVPTDFWAYKQVEYCVAQGAVRGYEDGAYRPADTVTRDQMAVFVARAFHLTM